MLSLNKITSRETHKFPRLRLDKYDIVFIFLLVISFAARMYIFDFPLKYAGTGGGQDYLIAHRIVQYNEFPLIGPPSHLYIYLGSPVYYYFISLFLFIKDSILFLSFVFVLLQLITITLIYKIAKNINSGTALIAALIFSFSAYILERSGYMTPNHAVQPFVSLGFLLLLLAHLRGSYKLLLSAAFVATFAATVHASVLAVLPLFIIFAFLILKQQNKGIKYYLGVLFTPLATLLLFHLPPLAYMIKNNLLSEEILPLLSGQGSRFLSPIFVQSISEFFQNMYTKLSGLLEIFSFTTGGPYFSLSHALTAVLVISTIIYFLKKNSPHKKYILIILLFVVQQLIFVSLLGNSYGRVYLTPILGIFAIFIAAIINSVFSKHIILNISKVVLVVLIITIASGYFYMFYSKPVPLENMRDIYSARDALVEEVLQIQKEEGYEDINFFHTRSFNNRGNGTRVYLIDHLSAFMKKRLDRKLTRVTDGGAIYQEINSTDYIFVSCYYERGARNIRKCKEHFLEFEPEYEIVKEVFRGNILSVYEAKKLTY